MLVRAVRFAWPLVLCLAACGGAPPEPAAPPPAQPPAAPSAPEAAHPKKTLADLQREFTDSCISGAVSASPNTSAADMHPYCECSWGQMTQTFTEDEMAGSTPDAAKVDQLKARVKSACARKLPEPVIKENFVKGCVGDRVGVAPYCECTFAEYRKTLSAGDLADEHTAESEGFKTATKGAAKACQAKLPSGFAHDQFLAGCSEDKAMKGFCECAFKEVSKVSGPGEIVAGLVDVDALRPKIDKACGKLKPAK